MTESHCKFRQKPKANRKFTLWLWPKPKLSRKRPLYLPTFGAETRNRSRISVGL